uniref:Uncharacterized protein AlNc14C27G2648 n=1 Tax=Albugo laibachii Nc14 TaxID=890382 RepID=F0W716_9STRA|nr:conserved hypothetical protein [Albugo laibachii Nc14]|eukprot:CCA16911.1 conserved hypothetical protein [Albugo laibachii Nc14]
MKRSFDEMLYFGMRENLFFIGQMRHKRDTSSYKAISDAESNSKQMQSLLHFHLSEEHLADLIFSFLSVRDHQQAKQCCLYWKSKIETLHLDRLDMSITSSICARTIHQALCSTIWHNYSSIRVLDLSGQRALTDKELLIVATKFWAHLEELIVDDCSELTDFGLFSIMNARSYALTTLSFRHCKRLTGNIAHYQISGCHPCLKSIDMYDTRAEYSFVNGLEKGFPALERINGIHTPAHLQLFTEFGWQDVLDDFRFLVMNQVDDLAHFNALLNEFRDRVDSQIEKRGGILTVFQKSLLLSGKKALVDVPSQQFGFNSALLFSCGKRLQRIVPLLLIPGEADTEVTQLDGGTPLCIAIAKELTQSFYCLVEAGADVNRRTNHQITPLYLATEMDRNDMVEFLLEHRADPDVPIGLGATALAVAARNSNRSMVLRFLHTKPALKQIIGNNDYQRTQYIQALFLACERGHASIVADILNMTGLNVEVLLDGKVSLLYLACQMGHDSVVSELLQRGANLNSKRPKKGVSCLYIAAQEGNSHVVECLTRYNVDIHAKMDDFSTALHIATRMGHFPVVRILLREGADINEQTCSGLAPLYIAAEEGHEKLVSLFIMLGAVLDKQTIHGTTALFKACQKGHTVIVESLLRAGANAQLPKHNGIYPLDAALLTGNYEITHLLLQYKATVGKLPFRFAEKRRDIRLEAVISRQAVNMDQNLYCPTWDTAAISTT